MMKATVHCSMTGSVNHDFQYQRLDPGKTTKPDCWGWRRGRTVQSCTLERLRRFSKFIFRTCGIHDRNVEWFPKPSTHFSWNMSRVFVHACKETADAGLGKGSSPLLQTPPYHSSMIPGTSSLISWPTTWATRASLLGAV